MAMVYTRSQFCSFQDFLVQMLAMSMGTCNRINDSKSSICDQFVVNWFYLCSMMTASCKLCWCYENIRFQGRWCIQYDNEEHCARITTCCVMKHKFAWLRAGALPRWLELHKPRPDRQCSGGMNYVWSTRRLIN